MDEELKKKLEDFEKRLEKLEEIVLDQRKTLVSSAKTYRGLTGGVRLLIDNGFFGEPKSVRDVVTELEREGYHYRKESVDKILRMNFTHNLRLLTRREENNVWVYSLRK